MGTSSSVGPPVRRRPGISGGFQALTAGRIVPRCLGVLPRANGCTRSSGTGSAARNIIPVEDAEPLGAPHQLRFRPVRLAGARFAGNGFAGFGFSAGVDRPNRRAAALGYMEPCLTELSNHGRRG